jgi:predicted ATPase/DNA-binding CsgD family transcriptional regulator
MTVRLLERETPLRVLDAALAEVTGGAGLMALVGGEAGLGKTTLVEQFVDARQDALRVLWGACDALATPRPLGPVRDMAAQLAGEWPALLAAADSNALYAAFLRELQGELTIAVFEDVHWADEATLDLLKFIGRRVARTSALLILTYRDDEVGPRHPLRALLGDLATSAAVRRIMLAPLSESAVGLLAEGRGLDPADLHRQTGGNPFYVTEVIGGAAGGPPVGSVPATVRDAVLARAGRLSPSGRAVLDAAAIVGPRIEPWVLAEMTGAEAGEIDTCLDNGMLVAQGNGLAFRHELARQAILETISPNRKLGLHRLALQTLQSSAQTGYDPGRLAYHAAGGHVAEAVLEYAPQAAQLAAGMNAHREAVTQYELALPFAQGMPLAERARMLEALAVELNIIDRRPEAIVARREAIDIWRSLGDRLNLGGSLALLMILHFGVGETAEAERVTAEAIEILETLPPSRELARAYRMRATLHMFNRDVAPAVAWGEKAIAAAARFNDYETMAGAYNAIGSALIVVDYERGREALHRSLAIGQQAGLDYQVANAYTNLGSASGEVYHFLDADGDLTAGIAFCLERDLDVSRLYMQAWRALTDLHLGWWDKAAEAAADVLNHPTVSSISRIMALLALGRLRARRGDPGAAEALDEALALAEQTQTLQRIAPVRAARAEAAWLAGDRARASVEAGAVYDLAVEKRHPWLAGELGFWRWRAGDAQALPAWVAEPFARQVAGDWRGAAGAWERLGLPYERARTLADGDPAARQAALAIFEQLGAAPAAEPLRRQLRALPARQVDKLKFGGLTAREQEAARWIAQGKTNREIAAAMTVGEKTVETYVTRILNKLGFDSRVQIATWAVEKGLGRPGE